MTRAGEERAGREELAVSGEPVREWLTREPGCLRLVQRTDWEGCTQEQCLKTTRLASVSCRFATEVQCPDPK